MPSKLLRLAGLIGSLVLTAVLVCGLGVVSARVRTSTVDIRGTAYEFNNSHTFLTGATIRVVEFPKLQATVGPDGRYNLQVPDHARVTPYIVDPGYHTIYLQTFSTDGENLVNVNFQTPTEGVYRALAALLKVPLDSQGNLRACAIVSTFSTRNVRGLSFAKFSAYGAHGVPGATATASPSLGKPVYFNKNVLPDPTRTKSSKDGGVLWTNVPAGVYTITGHDPATRFASFVATCRPGRVVNANPPWGLHELALPNPARISARWSVHGGRTRATSLSVRQLPTGAIIDVSCAGLGCTFGTRTFRPGGPSFDLRRAVGSARLELQAGDQLSVKVSAEAFNAVVVRWLAARGREPTRSRLCVPLGNVRARQHCPTA
jgi:hypothetical protein